MSVCIAIPTRGFPNWQTIERVQQAINKHKLDPIHYQPEHLSAANGRNLIVNWFLKNTKHDGLIMVDDDVVPHDDFVSIYNPDLDIVGAPYMIIREGIKIPYLCVYERITEPDPHWKSKYKPMLKKVYGLKGLHQVGAIGTGTIYLSRRVLEKIPAPTFHFPLAADGTMSMSEDIAFCEKAEDAGFKLFADFDHPSEHCVNVPLLRLHNNMMEIIHKVAG